MALFKILKGLSSNLESQPKKKGYAWYTTDDSKLYIDSSDEERQPLNAYYADKLKGTITSDLTAESINNKLETIMQSDWNESDETSMAYVKNRPFYESAVTILEEITATPDEYSKYVFESRLQGVEVNGKYIITIDGIKYNAVYIKENIGDGIIADYFVIDNCDIISLFNLSSISFTDTNSHTVKIEGATVIPLPEKYMPKDYLTVNNPYATGYILMNDNEISPSSPGDYSVSLGLNNKANGDYSVAIGSNNYASNYWSVAIGHTNQVTGNNATGIGCSNQVSNYDSVAIGYDNEVTGSNAIAIGKQIIAGSPNQLIQGQNNIADTQGAYLYIMGNGDSSRARSNAHTLDWSGNAWFAGDIYTGSTSGTNKDEGSKKLATEEFVTNSIPTAEYVFEIDLNALGYAGEDSFNTTIDSTIIDINLVKEILDANRTCVLKLKCAVNENTLYSYYNLTCRQNIGNTFFTIMGAAVFDLQNFCSICYIDSSYNFFLTSGVISKIDFNSTANDGYLTNQKAVKDAINQVQQSVDEKLASLLHAESAEF